MSCTVIFKQSYKARASPSSAGLNVRHLQYIATRPGAVYNQGCGFSLWGQAPGESGIRIQTDLEQAKRNAREASANHTLYRAILSVGKKDAEANGLYSRDRWEDLINNHIQTIAKEMDIKPENFCWYAAMHYSKNHPHVHLLYWDNGDQPKPEFIPKQQFEAKAERIRAEFAGEIHREEIRAVQKEQQEQIQPLRNAIQAMCLEANPEKALDLPKLYRSDALDDLSSRMAVLIRDLPAKGSLRYGYLPKEYKLKVDELIRACLEVPELKAQVEQYEKYTRQISTLYANGEAGTEAALEKAREKLHKALGNQVMESIRDIRSELRESNQVDQTSAGAFIKEAVQEIVPHLDSYQELKALLPNERIPANRMEYQIPGYHDQMNKVVGEIMSDARVRLRLQGYALNMAGIDLKAKPDAPREWASSAKEDTAVVQPAAETETQAPVVPKAEDAKEDPTGRVLFGKLVSDEEWDSYQDIYRDTKKGIRDVTTGYLREDVGWTDEAIRTGTASLLMGMMRAASQAAYQRQAASVQARLNLKNRSKDKSREAKRDYWATQNYASQWGDGYY